MGTINAEWHQAHVLGSHASTDERVEWHREHAQHCGCRTMPESIRELIIRSGRGDELPADPPR